VLEIVESIAYYPPYSTRGLLPPVICILQLTLFSPPGRTS